MVGLWLVFRAVGVHALRSSKADAGGMLGAVPEGMTRARTWLLAAVVAFSGLAGGCYVRSHGHVAWAVPPLVAAAVIAANAGHVWIDGHWDWVGGRWVWSDGYWVAERPGFVWEPGVWIHVNSRYEYRPGRWRDAHRVEVRDHRR